MKTLKQRGGLSPEEWKKLRPLLLAYSDMNKDMSYSVSYQTVLPFLKEILRKEEIDDRERDLISAVMTKYLNTSFNFDSESSPLITEPVLEKRLVYVLGENHREQDDTNKKIIDITTENTDFLLFTESTDILNKQTAIGMKQCIPIPYSVETFVMCLTFFYGVKMGDRVIPSFQKTPSDIIQMLVAKELGLKISKDTVLEDPDSVIEIIKERISNLCERSPGENAFLISSQLNSIKYDSINEDIKSHPIIKASLKLVDELIIENIEKEKGRSMDTVFIIIVGQNHSYNLVEKLSELGYLVKAINQSEEYIDELGLSGGKRKKLRTKRKRKKN
jgi:hypothetical protein